MAVANLQIGVFLPELGHRTLVLRQPHGQLLLLLVQPLPQLPHLLLVLARLAHASLVQHSLRVFQFLVSHVQDSGVSESSIGD
eukprot:COSAG03_NODE_1855_length_3430_cov_243.628940_4_plen_83_part_00